MLQEIELKLKIENEKEAKSLIEKLNGLCGGKVSFEEQRDEYYDDEEKTISNNDLVMRLRILNDRPIVAFKSPRIFLDSEVNKRIELEFEAKNAADVREKLARRNLNLTVVIEKRRWEFEWEEAKIAVDELPYIGWFAEIEGKGLEHIKEIVEKLELENCQKEKRHYGEILHAKLKEMGIPDEPNMIVEFSTT